jgi:hypothetical protein
METNNYTITNEDMAEAKSFLLKNTIPAILFPVGIFLFVWAIGETCSTIENFMKRRK